MGGLFIKGLHYIHTQRSLGGRRFLQGEAQFMSAWGELQGEVCALEDGEATQQWSHRELEEQMLLDRAGGLPSDAERDL